MNNNDTQDFLSAFQKPSSGGVLKNFSIFTGKHMCWILFLIKLQAWTPFSHSTSWQVLLTFFVTGIPISLELKQFLLKEFLYRILCKFKTFWLVTFVNSSSVILNIFWQSQHESLSWGYLKLQLDLYWKQLSLQIVEIIAVSISLSSNT